MSDGEWMTWAEAAERLGVKPESVQRRARSRRWARHTGNDGRARVLVPHSAIPDHPAERPADSRDDVPPVIPPDHSAITERAIRAEARAEAAEARIADLEADRERWRGMAERLLEARAAVPATTAPASRGLWWRIFGRE